MPVCDSTTLSLSLQDKLVVLTVIPFYVAFFFLLIHLFHVYPQRDIG